METPSVPLFRGRNEPWPIGRGFLFIVRDICIRWLMEDSLLFEKKQNPYPSSPYMERLKLRTAETDSSSCVLVSRDDAMGDERDLLGPPV